MTTSNANSDVNSAREAGADVVICYVSWGKMLDSKVTDTQKQIAKVLVNAGVDVIIGYGPHLVQPAMWLEAPPAADGAVHRTLILLSAGNFLSDQRDKYTDSSVIFDFTIQETGPATGEFTITNPTYIPTYVWRNDEGGNKYTYHTLPVGKWLEEQPEGMVYTDVTRMREVWAEVQGIMNSNSTDGSNVAEIAPE